MKYLHHFLILLAIGLLTACKSESIEDVKEPEPFVACGDALDGWEVTSMDYPSYNLLDLVFLNDQIGFTCNAAGGIYKTTDGGQTWVFQHGYYTPLGVVDDQALTNALLSTIDFVDEEVGYIGGYGEQTAVSSISNEFAFYDTDAVLLKTTDGGATWTKQYVPGIYAINDLRFIDEQTGIGSFGYYAADSSMVYRLFKTTDGGANWGELDMGIGDKFVYNLWEAPSYLVTFVQEAYNYGALWKSLDEGLTWQEVAPLPFYLEDLQVLTDELIVAKDFNKLYKSTDGGLTWSAIDSPFDFFRVFHFSSENEGFVLGTETDEPTGPDDDVVEVIGYSSYQTKDGGKTWEKRLFNVSCGYVGPTFLVENNSFYTFGGDRMLNKFELK
jgi:photosystem II stability/assembly factor-like uncharacterized protein